MQQARLASEWKKVIKYMLRIVSLVHLTKRGRIISLVKSHALLGNPCISKDIDPSKNKREVKACKRMRKVLELDSKTLMPKIIKKWSLVLDLFDKELHYQKNSEFCKVVNMCIISMPLIDHTLKTEYICHAPLDYVKPVVPVSDWLTLYGISNDLHIRGLSEKSLTVFLHTGMKTDDTCDFRIGGLSIDILEKNYAAQKQAAMILVMEQKHANPKKRKKHKTTNHGGGTPDIEEGGGGGDGDSHDIVLATVKRQKVVHDEAKTMVMQRAMKDMKTFKDNLPSHIDFCTESNTVSKDTDLIEPIGNILGFKNLTSVCITKASLGPFPGGVHVFSKIGETRERNDMSGFMYDCMRQLKMPSVKTYVVPVIWDEAKWKMHSEANVTPKTKTWGNSMLVKMRAKALKYKKMNLHMSMQVCELFKGNRLGWVKELHPEMIIEILQNPLMRNTFGKTLFEMIFFAVYAGVIDSGPFNSMLNSDGQVLLVDINIADELAMLLYNTKGLYRASKKFDDKHICAVISYVNTHFAEAADFITRLKQSGCKNPYLLLNEMCPFFNDENVELLRTGQKTSLYFKFLINSLQYNPAKKGVSPPQFLG